MLSGDVVDDEHESSLIIKKINIKIRAIIKKQNLT